MAGAAIFTAGLSLLGSRVEPYVCPVCGTKTKVLAPRDIRQQVKQAVASGDNATLQSLGYVPGMWERRLLKVNGQSANAPMQTYAIEAAEGASALPLITTCWAPGCGEPVAEGEFHYCVKHVAHGRAVSDERDLTMKPFDPFEATSTTNSAEKNPSVPSPDRVETAASAEREADDVFEMIRKLGELRDSGLLTPDEFDAKKAQLLQRL